MPLLNRQWVAPLSIPGQPGASSPPAPPNALLIANGPCVDVVVSLAQPMAAQLTQAGVAIPPPQTVVGLIDTGASISCIDDGVAQRMGLPVVGSMTMASASHAANQVNMYPVQLEFAGSGIVVTVLQVAGAALASQGLGLLIGRDILQHGMLVYNGQTGLYTLAM